MNIALVHDWLTNMAGAEKVLLELTKIYPDAPIYTSVFDPKGSKAFANKKVVTSFLQKFPLVKKKRELLIPFTPFVFEQFNLDKYDVVISNNSFPSKGVLTKPDTIHICYCHTPARYLWEPEVDDRASNGFFSGLRKKTAHNLRIWDRVAADRVDYYFANSKYIAERIKKYYEHDSKVIYPPVDVDKFKIAKKEDIGDYFLFVSRLVPYKKCDLVIEAFNDLGLPLKVIGRGPERNRLIKMAKENIEFLGFLSDEELRRYYARAKAFIFAAEEDFGIVPVEAMAAGRPVIAYGAGGVLETVVENKTGIFFKEQTPQCLIEAVRSFKGEEFDPKEIRNQAEKFSTKRFLKEFAEKVDNIILKTITDNELN